MIKKIRGAVLIYGGRSKDRKQEILKLVKKNDLELNKNNPDIKILRLANNRKSIGINKVRESISFLSQKPYMSETKFVIIRGAHLLTRQAQNALLKTLEEPPSYAIIILETNNKNELLDTVLSRCQKIRIRPQTTVSDDKKALPSIKKLSPQQKLELAEKFSRKSNTQIIRLLDRWIENERENLRKSGEKKKTNLKQIKENLENLENIRRDLNNTNVNTQIALEYLLLKLS